MTGIKADPTEVPADFIEENKKIHLAKPSHFAPYTKAQRRKRRAEVYRLHFEQNVPATRIAEMMKVDRNTVKNDLKILYHEAMKDYDPDALSLEGYLEKQLVRLEAQRDRLMTLYSSADSIKAKLAIESLIADIDFKLLQSVAKVQHGYYKFWDQVVEEVNKVAKEHGMNFGFTSIFEMKRVSVGLRKRMDKLVEDIKDKEEGA